MTGAGSAVMRGRLSSLATSAFERPVYFRLWRVSDSANQGNASEIVLSIVHGGAPSSFLDMRSLSAPFLSGGVLRRLPTWTFLPDRDASCDLSAR